MHGETMKLQTVSVPTQPPAQWGLGYISLD